MINRKYLLIMVGILVLGLIIGFVWSIALNISATSRLNESTNRYVELARDESLLAEKLKNGAAAYKGEHSESEVREHIDAEFGKFLDKFIKENNETELKKFIDEYDGDDSKPHVADRANEYIAREFRFYMDAFLESYPDMRIENYVIDNWDKNLHKRITDFTNNMFRKHLDVYFAIEFKEDFRKYIRENKGKSSTAELERIFDTYNDDELEKAALDFVFEIGDEKLEDDFLNFKTGEIDSWIKTYVEKKVADFAKAKAGYDPLEKMFSELKGEELKKSALDLAKKTGDDLLENFINVFPEFEQYAEAYINKKKGKVKVSGKIIDGLNKVIATHKDLELEKAIGDFTRQPNDEKLSKEQNNFKRAELGKLGNALNNFKRARLESFKKTCKQGGFKNAVLKYAMSGKNGDLSAYICTFEKQETGAFIKKYAVKIIKDYNKDKKSIDALADVFTSHKDKNLVEALTKFAIESKNKDMERHFVDFRKERFERYLKKRVDNDLKNIKNLEKTIEKLNELTPGLKGKDEKTARKLASDINSKELSECMDGFRAKEFKAFLIDYISTQKNRKLERFFNAFETVGLENTVSGWAKTNDDKKLSDFIKSHNDRNSFKKYAANCRDDLFKHVDSWLHVKTYIGNYIQKDEKSNEAEKKAINALKKFVSDFKDKKDAKFDAYITSWIDRQASENEAGKNMLAALKDLVSRLDDEELIHAAKNLAKNNKTFLEYINAYKGSRVPEKFVDTFEYTGLRQYADAFHGTDKLEESIKEYNKNDHLQKALNDYLKEKFEGFAKEIVDREIYFVNGNSGPAAFQKQQAVIREAKNDAGKFLDLIKEKKAAAFSIANIRAFDRVGGLVRFEMPDGFVEEMLRDALEKIGRSKFNENTAEELKVISNKLKLNNKQKKRLETALKKRQLNIKKWNYINKRKDEIPEKKRLALEEIEKIFFKELEKAMTREQIETFGKQRKIDKPFEAYLKEDWTVKDARDLLAILENTIPRGKDIIVQYKCFMNLIIYLENPGRVSDHEYVFFMTRKNREGNYDWIPVYYNEGRKVINPLHFLLDKKIADIPKYSRIIYRLQRRAREEGNDRQKDNIVSNLEGVIKNNLRTLMNHINNKPAPMTWEKFADWGVPSFFNEEDKKRKRELLEKYWDTFRKHAVFKPEEEPDKPVIIKAAYPNIIPSSLKISGEFDTGVKDECIGAAMKVLFQATRKRSMELGKKLANEDWFETRWNKVLYVMMIRHLNPKTKEFRWLPVSLSESYDSTDLRVEIKKELECRKALQK